MALKNGLFIDKLKFWYEKNHRKLPWRETKNPYFIWLSEIILQQTRVAQGLPYYLKFVDAFPTIKDFADAHEDEVLRLWQGLGYYSRARNMHATAKIISEQMHGIFPKDYKSLQKLKGVGTYTAAAIASFSYNEDVAVVDGNVYRVLSRFFGIETDISSPKGKKEFSELANEIVPKNDSASHNQAIMEFGAMLCTPKNPQCSSCPVADSCFAFLNNKQQFLPVNLKKVKITSRFLYYFIIEFNGKIFMKKRTEKGIWHGLFDFLMIEELENKPIEYILESDELTEILKSATIENISEKYYHQLTHQKLEITFIHLKMNSLENDFFVENKANFYDFEQVENLPKPIVIANFLKKFY
jgi:A/G-specific adenine glycosylase